MHLCIIPPLNSSIDSKFHQGELLCYILDEGRVFWIVLAQVQLLAHPQLIGVLPVMEVEDVRLSDGRTEGRRRGHAGNGGEGEWKGIVVLVYTS